MPLQPHRRNEALKSAHLEEKIMTLKRTTRAIVAVTASLVG